MELFRHCFQDCHHHQDYIIVVINVFYRKIIIIPLMLMIHVLFLSKYKLARPRRPSWQTVCEKTRWRSCDLTGLRLHHLGLYRLQVRASREGRHSAWVGVDFCPDQDGERERDAHTRKYEASHDLQHRPDLLRPLLQPPWAPPARWRCPLLAACWTCASGTLRPASTPP